MSFYYGNILIVAGFLLVLLVAVTGLIFCICRSPQSDSAEPQKQSNSPTCKDFADECERAPVGSMRKITNWYNVKSSDLDPYAVTNENTTTSAKPCVPRIILTTASFRSRQL